MPQTVSNRSGWNYIGVSCFKPSWSGDVALTQLTRLHPGCNRLDQSQGPDCMAAVHRWCAADGRGGAGLAQEISNGVFGVACFKPTKYSKVGTSQSRACSSPGNSQSMACVAALHRWCNSAGPAGSVAYAGLSQEVGNSELWVACVQSTKYEEVTTRGANFD
jgi:hypothetical protein